MRLFVAINVSDRQKRKFQHFQHQLKEYMDGVHWVDHTGIHLTLKFLGETSTQQLNPLCEALHRSVAGTEPFFCSFGGGGVFPDPARARVIWVGLKAGTEAVCDLAKNIERELAKLFYPEEKRPYKPHLTLGRLRYPLSHDRIQRFLDQASVFITDEDPIDSITLYESILTQHGARYRAMCRIDFDGNYLVFEGDPPVNLE